MVTLQDCQPLLAPATGPDATHFLYPSARHPRFALPLNPDLAAAGLGFFSTWRQRFAMGLERTRSQLQENGTTVLLEGPALAAIKRKLDQAEHSAVISFGTPGPYNKQTILLQDPTGSPLTVLKVGQTAEAKALLAHEARQLHFLARHTDVRAHVPQVLLWETSRSWSILAQSPALGSFAGKRLTPAHLAFLSRLQDATREEDAFSKCRQGMTMRRRYETLRERLSPCWSRRAAQTLVTLEESFGERHLPLALAHGDFSPWNLRVRGGELHVFDWEFASPGYLPLYDLFHFQLLPSALRGEISQGQIAAALARARRLAAPGDARWADLQLLAYLLDLALLFLESRNGVDHGDRIVHRYGSAIDRFEQWRIK